MAGESQQVMKNITRVIDRKKRINGYYVRLQWKGQSYAKLFSCKDDDLEIQTLHRAITWRDRTEMLIGKPRTERLIIGNTRTTNTGEKGIRQVEVQHHKHGTPVGRTKPWYIVTAFDHEGKRHRTGISIEKHGAQQAFAFACQRYQERSAMFTNAASEVLNNSNRHVSGSPVMSSY